MSLLLSLPLLGDNNKRPESSNHRLSGCLDYLCLRLTNISSVCAFSDCCVVYSKQHGARKKAWKMLGVYKPMIWTAKLYRTFRQIPTFAKVLFCPVVKILPQILPLVIFLEKGKTRSYEYGFQVYRHQSIINSIKGNEC